MMEDVKTESSGETSDSNSEEGQPLILDESEVERLRSLLTKTEDELSSKVKDLEASTF